MLNLPTYGIVPKWLKLKVENIEFVSSTLAIVSMYTRTEFLEAPDFFYRLAPQALSCRLGTSDHIWGKLSQNMMETLTLNKQLLCTVVGGTSWPHYAVKLQDSVNGEITDIAEELTKGNMDILLLT